MTDAETGDGCGCHADEKRAAHDPAYRRALWIVVVLNLGFDVIEIIGGFLAGSQALTQTLSISTSAEGALQTGRW